MKQVADSQQWREQAAQAVERFVRRFDESYRLLAYHAALPLVLTPELVNYLRNEFLRNEQVPWVAEVDLLLSDLCSQVGYELYAMDTHVRAYLLKQMEQHYGKRRMQEVAQVLISYVNYLSRLHPERRRQEIEAQQWAAMVYLGDEKCKAAVQEIAQQFMNNSSGQSSQELTASKMRAELARLAQITEELSPQLQEEEDLLEYARVVQCILRTPAEVDLADLQRSYLVGGVELFPPSGLLPENLAKTIFPPKKSVTGLDGFPPIQTFEFEIATVIFEDKVKPVSSIDLHPFEFEVATIQFQSPIKIAEEAVLAVTEHSLDDLQKSIIEGTLNNQTYNEIAAVLSNEPKRIQSLSTKLWKLLTEVLGQKVTKTNLKTVLKSGLTIRRHRQQAQHYIEDLGNGINLEMVAIPEGNFLMGSPENEPERLSSESPQHPVSIKPFFLGKYPITQAQWQAVASLPQVNRELNADPSNFKGNNRPVERISWHDAVEFCDRLSQFTGKPYRLPSEAEWEYACRAGTTTPFHFGETITSDLANYDANYTYGAGVKGVYRQKTTRVGSFGVANAFGLYDMHGNVWEWCADHWHDNYEGAPNNGEAWIDNDNHSQMLRGGSWFFNPGNCRSALRLHLVAGWPYYVGFRVACAAAWTK